MKHHLIFSLITKRNYLAVELNNAELIYLRQFMLQLKNMKFKTEVN
jgi:hypothetical protein